MYTEAKEQRLMHGGECWCSRLAPFCLQSPLAYVNQPKALVASEGYRKTTQLEGKTRKCYIWQHFRVTDIGNTNICS
jgi:hypothetical protein